ncbi:MAG: HAD hydrolase family protein [Ruminococcus sp.]|nr:HAD hydrolase family protein [Ruminococcus sp.]
MITFLADLDNTLIYSYRREIIGEKLEVEWINGKLQSYMTKHTYDFLTKAENMQIIPITSRTPQQYERLSEIMEKLKVKYAVICNGGILLEDGKVNKEWYEETLRLTAKAQKEMKKACEILKEENPVIHETENIMVYAVVEEPQKVEQKLKNALDEKLVMVFCDHRKVYCLPKEINKGNAVKRLIEKGIVKGIAAASGDGEQDISMLEQAEYPIVPETLADRVKNSRKHIVSNSPMFSDNVCDEIKKLTD